MTPSQDEFASNGNGLRNAHGRRRPLDRPERIRREVARLFWRWHEGDILGEEATRAAYLLKTLYSMLEGSETSRRLDQLEARVAELLAP